MSRFCVIVDLPSFCTSLSLKMSKLVILYLLSFMTSLSIVLITAMPMKTCLYQNVNKIFIYTTNFAAFGSYDRFLDKSCPYLF